MSKKEEQKFIRDTARMMAQNVRLKKKLKKYENWDEEFEDELFHSFGYEGGLYSNRDDSSKRNVELIFAKYLDVPSSHENQQIVKVKIKARKGAILIERID